MNQETQVIFERLLLERGLVAPDQLAQAKRLHEKLQQRRKATTLLDTLLDQKSADPTQLREAARLAMIRSGAERVSIGGFELLEKIGQGGMGAVYRAAQTKVGRYVALKLMRPKLAREQRYLERFLREARASARLNHPNIVQGIDAGMDKGYYYFAMEFVEGDTLRRIIQREQALAEPEVVKIGLQITRALAEAHKVGMVHRDIKPENILMEHGTGLAKLADLGLVKSSEPDDTSVTQAGVALGTPNYISPEQARGDQVIDIRSDIYALGATLYHAVTGTLPFDGESPPVIMGKHIAAPLESPRARNPEVSAGFSAVIQKMMAKKPEERYQNPDELLNDLARVARGDLPLAARTPNLRRRRAGRVPRSQRRSSSPLAVTLWSLAALGLLGLIVAIFASGRDNTGGRLTAEQAFAQATTLIREKPLAFNDIVSMLQQSIDLNPAGEHVEAARTLVQIAKEFAALTAVEIRRPEDWAETAARLKALAQRSPQEPSYRQGIHDYRVALSHQLMDAAMREAISNPMYIPAAQTWFDAVDQAAPDAETQAAVQAKRKELGALLHRNADIFLDIYAAKIKELVEEGRFGEAIRVLRTSATPDLVTPLLQSLIDKRVEVLREQAEKYVAQEANLIWDYLNLGALDAARTAVDKLKSRLGLPELADRVAVLDRTVSAASEFLPLFEQLDALHEAEPRDAIAVAEAALKLREQYPNEPYVAQRLEPFAGDIQRLLALRGIETKLDRAEALSKEGQHAEANAILVELLKSADLTDRQRDRAVQMRVSLGLPDKLPAILLAELKKILPVEQAELRLENTLRPVAYRITEATEEGVRFEIGDRKGQVAWKEMRYRTLHDLARGSLGLIRDDNIEGLYHLGVRALDEDLTECKALLTSVVEAAEKRTVEDFPDRDVLIRSAKSYLAQVADKEAEAGFRRLRGLVLSVRTLRDLDAAVNAWKQFMADYGTTAYVKTQADDVNVVGAALSDTIVRLRAGALKQQVDNSDWKRLVPQLEQILVETAAVVPLAEERRKTIESLVTFGKQFLVEERIYRAVFSVMPWNKQALTELVEGEEANVAQRAKHYQDIFKHEVVRQADAEEQRRFVRYERVGEARVYVKELSERLARYNAVYRYWHRTDPEVCYQTEVDVAGEFRHYGVSGHCMTILMMDNFLALRRRVSADLRAQAEFVRLQAFVGASKSCPFLRSYLVERGRAAMREYGSVGKYAARFCLVVAEQYEAASDDDNALSHFDMLVNGQDAWSDYRWHGYLGRGRVLERTERFDAALADYNKAFELSSGWYNGYRSASRIVNLCLHSGRFDRPERAREVVDLLVERATQPKQVDRTRALLEKK